MRRTDGLFQACPPDWPPSGVLMFITSNLHVATLQYQSPCANRARLYRLIAPRGKASRQRPRRPNFRAERRPMKSSRDARVRVRARVVQLLAEAEDAAAILPVDDTQRDRMIRKFVPGMPVSVVTGRNSPLGATVQVLPIRHVGQTFVQLSNGSLYSIDNGLGLTKQDYGYIVPMTE